MCVFNKGWRDKENYVLWGKNIEFDTGVVDLPNKKK